MNSYYTDLQYDPADEPTRLCDGCWMRILLTEVVSPADWSEAYCVLCMSPVPEISK